MRTSVLMLCHNTYRNMNHRIVLSPLIPLKNKPLNWSLPSEVLWSRGRQKWSLTSYKCGKKCQSLYAEFRLVFCGNIFKLDCCLKLIWGYEFQGGKVIRKLIRGQSEGVMVKMCIIHLSQSSAIYSMHITSTYVCWMHIDLVFEIFSLPIFLV